MRARCPAGGFNEHPLRSSVGSPPHQRVSRRVYLCIHLLHVFSSGERCEGGGCPYAEIRGLVPVYATLLFQSGALGGTADCFPRAQKDDAERALFLSLTQSKVTAALSLATLQNFFCLCTSGGTSVGEGGGEGWVWPAPLLPPPRNNGDSLF